MPLVNATGMSVFGGGRMYAVDEITRRVCLGVPEVGQASSGSNPETSTDNFMEGEPTRSGRRLLSEREC